MNAGYLLENKLRVLSALSEKGVKSITVDYDGSGDSGQVTNIYPDPPPGTVKIWSVSSVFVNGGWANQAAEKTVSLSDALEAIATDLLDYKGIDWYNHDGGFGTVEIDVENQLLNLNHNYREISNYSTEF